MADRTAAARLAAVAVAVVTVTGCTRLVAGAATVDRSDLAAGCPGQTATTRVHDPLGSAVSKANPRGVPPNTDSTLTGSQSVDMIAKGYASADQPRAREALTTNGYADGYQRIWSQGSYTDRTRHTELVAVYRFRTAAGACRFAAWEAGRASLSPDFPVPAVPGAVGTASAVDKIYTGFAVATKSRYVLEASALSLKGAVAAWVQSLLTDTYRGM